MYATSAGESAIVELLISRGANADEVDADRISVLGWAAISNRLSVHHRALADLLAGK